MKRGLKVDYSLGGGIPLGSSNLCPDEKGTESMFRNTDVTPYILVATFAPMKRGLKVYVERLGRQLPLW